MVEIEEPFHWSGRPKRYTLKFGLGKFLSRFHVLQGLYEDIYVHRRPTRFRAFVDGTEVPAVKLYMEARRIRDRSKRPKGETVPLTGSGGSYSSCYRSMKTYAEIRDNEADRDIDLGDFGIHKGLVRGRRLNLPSSWSDVHRSRQRSWKRQGKGRKSWDK